MSAVSRSEEEEEPEEIRTHEDYRPFVMCGGRSWGDKSNEMSANQNVVSLEALRPPVSDCRSAGKRPR